MKRSRFLVIPFAALTALLGGCASTPSAPGPIVVPDAIKTPEGQTLTLKLVASGVQIYECKPVADTAVHYQWTLRAPEADLYDQAGRRMGRHFAGPTWEAFDGSSVTGVVQAHADSPDQKSIPWLLLTAKSRSSVGVFGAVQFVQRLNTVGGKAPADGCSAGTTGTEARMPYSAEYYFYSAGP